MGLFSTRKIVISQLARFCHAAAIYRHHAAINCKWLSSCTKSATATFTRPFCSRCCSLASQQLSDDYLCIKSQSSSSYRQLVGRYKRFFCKRTFCTCLLAEGNCFNGRSLHCNSYTGSKADAYSAEILTEPELTKLAEKIVLEASRVDVMVKSVPKTRVEQLILDLHNCGLVAADIHAMLIKHPRYITSNKVVAMINTLLTNGLQLSHVLSLLQDFENVIDLNGKKIAEVFDALRDARIFDKNVSDIIRRNPRVLLLTKKDIGLQVGNMRQLFTTADAVTLVKQCPQVLTDDWTENQAKFSYIFHEMKVTQKQMVYASCFRHSLQHIKQRHMFLVRTGMFDMLKRREGEKSPNARLDQIIDSTDEAFCRKFGGFRLEEYRAFCKLFDKEASQVESDDEI